VSALRYLPCELHCHSRHSDGSFEVPELLRAGKEEGLSLLALTDHNTASGCAELGEELQAETLRAVPGIEWTTDYGHLVVLGARRYVDWRSATLENIDSMLGLIREAGGVCGIAHPFRHGFPICCGCSFEFRPTRFDLVDYVEVWSELFDPDSECNRRALEWWAGLLDRGFRIAAGYGRDWHGRSKEAGLAARTYLGFAEGRASAEGALSALRGARTVVSLGPLATFTLQRGGEVAAIGDRVAWLGGASSIELSFEALIESPSPAREEAYGMRPLSMALVGLGGRTLWEGPASSGARLSGRFACDSPYARLVLRGECRGRACDLALSSPIWLDAP
jgi:hypothetical protein